MLYNSYSLVFEWVLSFMSSIPESSVAHFIGASPESGLFERTVRFDQHLPLLFQKVSFPVPI